MAITIGVFDSGVGGLTVLRALLPLISGARYLYLGDTARLPYGSKSRETVARFAASSARFLVEQGAEHLVIACNTATALALEDIVAAVDVPVTGVIEPGVAAAALYASASPPPGGERVLVLATEATVQSGAYTKALARHGLKATERACPLLVPLVEGGWSDATRETSAVTAEVLRIYLDAAREEAPDARSLLLGCTHYPLLKPLIDATLVHLGYPLHLVDAAQATAQVVASAFSRTGAFVSAEARFFATDSIDRFEQLGSRFLGRPLGKVELLDLGG